VAPPEDAGRLFDRFHADYEEALARALSVSGEDRLFFARQRITFLAACLHDLGLGPRSVMDYGCGTGAAAPLFRELLRVDTVLGVDASEKSLAAARKAHGSPGTAFLPVSDYRPTAAFPLVYCNGVFHHVPPAQRPAVVRLVRESLEPGGLFALWDNNRWNPGARLVMRRIPFDRGAVVLSAREARRLLEREGFEVVRVDHLFVFPRLLRLLRPLETRLARLPLGAQFQVLARRPGGLKPLRHGW